MKTHEDWMVLWFLIGAGIFTIIGMMAAVWLAGYTVLRARAKDSGMTYKEYLNYLETQRRE
jgi:hypothetical protein